MPSHYVHSLKIESVKLDLFEDKGSVQIFVRKQFKLNEKSLTEEEIFSMNLYFLVD